MEHLTRQYDLIPMNILGTPITIIGAGAVGSWITLTLAKMGFGDITVWDYDVVDTVNMNCQFYRFGDIGKKKVDALFYLVKDFTNIQIKMLDKKYEGMPLKGIVISAVDSMAARKAIFESNNTGFVKWIIDPRMGGEFASMYVVNMLDAKSRDSYKNALHSDEDSVHERCTAKATMYTVNLLGGLIAKAIKDVLTGQPYTGVVQWDISKNDVHMFNKE